MIDGFDRSISAAAGLNRCDMRSCRVDYTELPLPPELDGLVAAVWTARVPLDAGEWVAHEAVPDGCIELIRRHAGRSCWRSEQPALFAAGLATTTARLQLGAGAHFTGVKLWPWAWHALGGAPCPSFADGWIAVDPADLPGALLTGGDAGLIDRLMTAFADAPGSELGAAILASASAGEIARRAGLAPRQLQRRFAAELGMPPRSYLRLLRFRGALMDIQQRPEGLADTAAAQGYADQAHMTREFRALAGLPPGAARTRAKGPFL
jgi:AraC-like DNA-binding protein